MGPGDEGIGDIHGLNPSVLTDGRGRRGSSQRFYVGIFIMFYIFLCILGCFYILGFPGGSVLKNLPANAGDAEDVNSIPGSGKSSEEGNGTHSNILAWKIPWTEEPGRL